ALFAARRLAHHLDIVLKLQEIAQALPYHTVVVDQKDAEPVHRITPSFVSSTISASARRRTIAGGSSPDSADHCSRGTTTTTSVPLPGCERSSRVPPSSAARSRMLVSPRFRPLSALYFTVDGSKPRP